MIIVNSTNMIAHRRSFVDKKILYLGFMSYTSIPILLVFENITFRCLYMHVVMYLTLKSTTHTHTHTHIHSL